MVNITHNQYRPLLYILVKGDIIDVNPYTIQVFHRVKCIWLKGHIQATAYLRVVAFMIVFALHPEAIIRGWLL